MTKTQDLLILKYQDFHAETSGFFKELNKNPDLRSLFFTNPSLVLRTKLPSLSSINIGDQQDELANRVLFSALSNESFMTFLTEYQQKKNKALKRFLKSPGDELAARELDERTIRLELAEALLKHGDKELLSNLVGSPSMAKSPGARLALVNTTVIAIWIILIVGSHGCQTSTNWYFSPNSYWKTPYPRFGVEKDRRPACRCCKASTRSR